MGSFCVQMTRGADNVNQDLASDLPFCPHVPKSWQTQTGKKPMTSLFQILLMILNVIQFVIFAHIIMSWLINFQVLNIRQPIVAQIWYGLNRLLDPIYSRIRSFLPSMGGLDLAPLIALLVVYALKIILINNVAAFY